MVFAAFSSWCEVDGETDGEVLEGLRRLAERGGRGRPGVSAQGKGFNLVDVDRRGRSDESKRERRKPEDSAVQRHAGTACSNTSQQERRAVIGLTSEGSRARKRNDKRIGDSADDGGIHTLSSRLLLAITR